MKKINKIAAQDAARYIEANAFISDVGNRFYTDPAYAKAFNDAYENIQANQTAVLVAQKMGTPTAVKIRRGIIIGVAVVILHETGYDRVLWDKTKRAGRRLRRWAEQTSDEAKAAFPETTEKLSDVKDTVVETAQTVKDEAKERFGQHDYDPSYAPNIQKDTPSADR